MTRFRHLRFQWILSLVLVSILLAACGGDRADTQTNAAALQNTVPDSAITRGNDQAVPVNYTVGSSSDRAGAPALQATPTEPLAALVNGEPITMAEFERERERRTLGLDIPAANADAFDAEVLQAMIDQVLIAQAAADLGIVVTDAEIDAEIAVQEGIVAQNGQSLEEVVGAQGYTMEEYRDVQRDMLLSLKVSQEVVVVSPMAAQVHSRHILVADEATARDLIARIQAGEDFAQLATEYTLDGSTRPLGGDLDWVVEGELLQPEVEQIIFSLQPGQLYPEPVRSALGYHVIQVLDRVEDRPLSEMALAERKQQAFLRWLEDQRMAADIERYVGAGSQPQS